MNALKVPFHKDLKHNLTRSCSTTFRRRPTSVALPPIVAEIPPSLRTSNAWKNPPTATRGWPFRGKATSRHSKSLDDLGWFGCNERPICGRAGDRQGEVQFSLLEISLNVTWMILGISQRFMLQFSKPKSWEKPTSKASDRGTKQSMPNQSPANGCQPNLRFYLRHILQGRPFPQQ